MSSFTSFSSDGDLDDYWGAITQDLPSNRARTSLAIAAMVNGFWTRTMPSFRTPLGMIVLSA